MANLHLVTGYAGVEHVTSNDQGSFNAAMFGNGEFVLERGNMFSASIQSNNKVRVLDGDLLMQGRHIRLKENTYADLNFDNGTQGYKRLDLIVARYSKSSTTGIEEANLVVIKGVPSETAYNAPEKITGDILSDDALENDTVLYQVPFDGLNIQPLIKVFKTAAIPQEQIEKIVTPDFNDTGEVEGIESFTDFMASFVKNTSIYQFLANLKAGLKYVLHMGMMVNNGTCETPGKFPLDAAYGKTLTDMITGLNSDIDGIKFKECFRNLILTKNISKNITLNPVGNIILFMVSVGYEFITGISALNVHGRVYIGPSIYIDYTFNTESKVFTLTASENITVTCFKIM